MNYDISYFITKFEAIPEELWCTGKLAIYEQRCVLGHCGVVGYASYDLTPEALTLAQCLPICPQAINDFRTPAYPQPTPKQRILAALRDAQGKQNQAGENWELRPLVLTPKPQHA